MRPDMQEVLITPGRRGSGFSRNEELRKIRRKRIEDDETGWKQSCTPRGHHNWGDRKIDQKGDHVMPLKHWLEAQVGRPWDDIYSEIRKNNSPHSAVGAHIYTHLWGFVERNPTYREDGTPCRSYYYSWRETQPLTAGEMYIDRQGILRKAKGLPRKEVTKPQTVIQITSNQYAVMNKKGVWFLLKYSNRMTTEQRTTHVHDHWEKDESGASRSISREVKYEYITPYHTQVHLKRDDFTTLPRCHPVPLAYPYYYSTYDNRRIDKGKQHWYLVEYKTMSKKEKQKLGLT